MRKLIYISILALAGCTTKLSTEPGPPVTPNTSGYFWKDSTYRYQAQDGEHTLNITGVSIDDDNLRLNKHSVLTINGFNGIYSVSGFSPSDIFGFDPSIQIVSDSSHPSPWTEQISSIATSSISGHQMLLATSDSVLYQVDNSFGLDRVMSIPEGYTLAEDPEGRYMFLYRIGGDSIIWTDDKDLSNWFGVRTTSAVTAFTGVNYFSFNLCAFACGADIYTLSPGGLNLLTTLSGTVSSMTYDYNASTGGDGVLAGLADGDIYDVGFNGSQHFRCNIPSLTGLAFIWSGPSLTTLAGTKAGVYLVPASGSPKQLSAGAVTAVYSTGNSLFVATPDTVLHYFPSGVLYNSYSNPSPGHEPSEFAHPTSAIPSSSYGIYALSGGTIFRLDSIGASSQWTPANQTVNPSPWHPQPGALTLLSSDTSWTAGYAVSNVNGPGPMELFVYKAARSTPFAKVALDGVNYSDVLVASFTAYSHGVADTMSLPKFNIYFQNDVGPIRIERIQGGKTDITKLIP